MLRYFQVELREKLGTDNKISILQQNRLWWYGHVLWKEDNDWLKKCMEYELMKWRVPDSVIIRIGRVGGWMFLLVPAHLGRLDSTRQRTVKWLLFTCSLAKAAFLFIMACLIWAKNNHWWLEVCIFVSRMDRFKWELSFIKTVKGMHGLPGDGQCTVARH